MEPTSEQVIQWAREAGFPCIKDEPIIACGRDNLSRFASIVRSATLDDAAELARTNGIDGIPISGDEIVADWLQSLKGKQ